MGVNLKRKRGSSAMEVVMVMVMVALVLLINTNSCGASFVLKSNVTSYRQCISTGAIDGCLIADDLGLDFNFFMDTHVVCIILDETDQKLLGGGRGGTGGTPDPNRAACYKPDGKRNECDPEKEHLQKCGSTYLRDCYKPLR